MSASKVSPAPVTSRQASKTDFAYERILARILDGTYAPGSRLVLDRIARDLEVSTLPVREAIRRLEAEGYVHFQQNVGATVIAVDAESYVQAIETMAVLEGAATGQAASRLTASDLREVEAYNAAMVQALDRLDGPGYAVAHDALHAALIQPCPNSHLVDVITKERARLRRVRTSILGFGASGGRQDIADHVRLVEMISSGAPDADIEDFARAHLERSAASLRAATSPAD